jgi:ABC-2 type transport system permease protein
MGADWVSDPVPMGILAVMMPMVITGIIVPDSIAGERERHTLETLLASRLPDRAILFGKLGFAVAVGWATAPLELLVAVVVVNLAALDSAPLFYEPAVLGVMLLLAFLVALLTGAIGVFVSLRANSAQEAQQLTLMGLMLPATVIGMGFTLLLVNRDLARSVIDALGTVEARWVALAFVLVLAVVDVLLVAAADRRFRRGRLIARGA